MQAIRTRYHGPTNARGSRISAEADAGRIYVPYDHALSLSGNHEAAAREFANRLGWLSGTPDRPTSTRMELLSGSIKHDHVHVLRYLPNAEA